MFLDAAKAGLRGYGDLSALAAVTANSNLLIKRRNRSGRLAKLNKELFGKQELSGSKGARGGVVSEAGWAHVQAIVRAAVTTPTDEGNTNSNTAAVSTAATRFPRKQGAVRVLRTYDLSNRGTRDS